jgi:hypothetical protein
VYIPEKRTLRLVEIQESVLPEEEWLIGISDMGYFKGVGFSMPISKDSVFLSDVDEMTSPTADIIFEELEYDDDSVLVSDANDINQGLEIIDGICIETLDPIPSDMAPFTGLHLFNIDDYTLIEKVGWESEKSHLYAFIPGLFYCSNQATSVDGVAIQVTEKEMLGMTLASFRPEDVRSFDISSGIVLDDKGQPKTIALSAESLGKFETDIVLGDSSDSHNIITLSELVNDPYIPEIEIARELAHSIPLNHLKEAYVSGSFLESRLTKLMDSIETKKIDPRFKIYVRNEKYPNGKVVSIRYRSLDAVLDLNNETGIFCPEEYDLGIELQNLLFIKLAQNTEEVDIERAVLDTYELMHSSIGRLATKEQVLKMIFTEESSKS